MAMTAVEGAMEAGAEMGLQRHSRRSPRLQADSAVEVTDNHAAIPHEVVFGREVAGEVGGEAGGEAAGESAPMVAEVFGAEPKRQRCSETGRADSRQHKPSQLYDVPHSALQTVRAMGA